MRLLSVSEYGTLASHKLNILIQHIIRIIVSRTNLFILQNDSTESACKENTVCLD
jgi:hypothetical protein